MAMVGVDEQQASTDTMAQRITLGGFAATLDHRFDRVRTFLTCQHQRCHRILYLDAMEVVFDLLAIHKHFSGTAGREFDAGDGGFSFAGTVVVLGSHN